MAIDRISFEGDSLTGADGGLCSPSHSMFILKLTPCSMALAAKVLKFLEPETESLSLGCKPDFWT